MWKLTLISFEIENVQMNTYLLRNVNAQIKFSLILVQYENRNTVYIQKACYPKVRLYIRRKGKTDEDDGD